ncbi:hypothetical protein BGZ61DRAFT_488105 [Ilyonectria robusta]|uniref:uncharacterized protein n=1 Tax=Ilyonectria robusta TaxID=1079257 RepID=UPI001E8E5BDC|nr:uncharacterized protein BGZ61DRAFT_488105 [Ilyonectria robusta]KAH8648121.1 hypothetical protein BGZ61DRAFT_488105 [Ilyonectria robusta]
MLKQPLRPAGTTKGPETQRHHHIGEPAGTIPIVVRIGCAANLLGLFPLYLTIQTAAQHHLEVALIPTQLLIADPSLIQNLPRSSKDHFASARAYFSIVILFRLWARATDTLGEMELHTGWPAFTVVFGTDTTELIVFHTPLPVSLLIKKLAKDPAQTVLLYEI